MVWRASYSFTHVCALKSERRHGVRQHFQRSIVEKELGVKSGEIAEQKVF